MNTNGKVSKALKLTDIDPSTILAHTTKIKATNESDAEDHKLTTKEYGNGNYLFYFDKLKINKLNYVKDEGTEKLLCNFTMDLISEHHFKVDENASPIITRVIRFSYMRQGVRHSRDEQLTHDETFNLTEFKQRINGIGQLIFYGKQYDLLELFKCLDEEQQPKIVKEYDYDGFIKHDGEDYYLTNNAIFKLPNDKEASLKVYLLIENQYFKLSKGRYVSLKKSLKKTARFEPEIISALEKSGSNIQHLLSEPNQVEIKINEFTDLLGNMVAGQSGQTAWGKALFGYMMHFLFLDLLLTSSKGPQHATFLYLFGHGNSGKGELAKIISSFFGGSTMDMHSKPTESALGTLLSQRSGRPLFIDEFKPESVAKRERVGGIISDQTLNSAYQFDARNVKDMATGQIKDERIRTSLAFLSNYKPETDHLKSRMILLETSVSKRGKEHYLNQLKEQRVQLQWLFLSILQLKPYICKDTLLEDYLQVKTILTKLTKEKAIRQLGGSAPSILDRQSTSWALFICLHHHFSQSYRDKRYPQDKTDLAWLDQDFVELAINELLNNIMEMDDFNPLIKWLDAVAELVHQGKIVYGVHYGYAETNGEKGKEHLGIRIGRVMNLFNKEYPDLVSITVTTVESLLQQKVGASNRTKMTFSLRAFDFASKVNTDKTQNWRGIKISAEAAQTKDPDLWSTLKDTFPKPEH